MIQKPKVAIFTRYSRLGASSRLRFFQFLPELQTKFDIEVFPLFGDRYLERLYSGKRYSKLYVIRRYLNRFFQLWKVSEYSFLCIEKELFPFFPAWAESYLSYKKISYIVDYDDAIFHNYDLSNNFLKKILSNKIDNIIGNAAIVIAGNSYLADRAEKAGAENVEVLPTVVDFNRYAVRKKTDAKGLVVGWIGSPSTVKYLNSLTPVFTKLVKKYDFTLRVIGSDVEMPGVNIICIPWQEETEVGEIQKFDVGIMPLKDSPWERGKCGYKLIQYMACGIPVIASPVGVNTEIINNSGSGFLASDEEEWLLSFDKLLSDVNLRVALGYKGRLAVENIYSVQVIAPRLTALFNKIQSK